MKGFVWVKPMAKWAKKRSFITKFASGCMFILLVLALWVVNSDAGNAVRLLRMEPKGEVPTKTNLVFTFSSEVVPKSMVGKMIRSPKIRFRPSIQGKFRWLDQRRLGFYPETTLQPSTAYIVEFRPDLASELKKNLVGSRKLNFTTERFRITDHSTGFVYNQGRKQGLIFQARICFNYPVSADSLQRLLSLRFTDSRQPIRFTLRLNNGGREAVITSETLQRSNKPRTVEISLPRGFLCLGGNIGLEERFVQVADFREKQPLTIDDVSAQTEGRNTISIRCSEPIDSDAVENFISVTPSVKYRLSVSSQTITLSGDAFKAGQTYNVKIGKGLPSLNGNPLLKVYQEQVTFPDLEPSVNFNSHGKYLSNQGNLNLGLETVNISQVELEISKIYSNNIVSYLGRSSYEDEYYSGGNTSLMRMGRVLEEEKFEVQNIENEVVTTPLNLRNYLSDKRRGIFQVRVCDPDNRWRYATKVVIVTDLGILAKKSQNELIIWINSLNDLKPKAGVRVSLVSLNNQELLVGETDSRGIVRFEGLSQRIEGFDPYLILAEDQDDLSFLCLEDSLIDKTDFPVDGRPHLTAGYEAFLYTDRGVFRPGESANLMAIIRGPNAMVPAEFPVRLEIVGPDGMVFREFADSTRNSGVCQFEVEFPEYARTGKYRALLYVATESIGNTSFSVEEFMPDRIKVETMTDKEKYTRGDRSTIDVRGMNLYGPPAAGRRVDLSVRLEAVPFSTPAYRSFDFGRPSSDALSIEETIGQGELNEKGEASFSYDFPDNYRPFGMVRAVFQATVTEEGGRTVSSYKTVDYHPHKAYIGIKRGGDYYAKLGEDYPIQLVYSDTDGNLIVDRVLNVEIYSVTWNSIYRRDNRGNYTYHCEKEEDLLSTDTASVKAGTGKYSFRPQDWGCYKMVFIDPATGARNEMEIYATSWGYSPWAMDNPDRIQLDLDKKSYKVGQNAKIQVKAPFDGRALVTIEREKVHDIQVVEFKENTGVITVPVKESYKPNVYVTVEIIRATKKLDKRAPTRAYGTVPLMVDCDDERLDLKISSMEETRPNREIEIEISAAGGREDTFITLAAVDEGICQLTEFQTPDPMRYFYGKRALGLETYDLYGMLLPEVESVEGPKAPGGGDGEDIRRKNLNPISARRVKPVSLWSGMVKPDKSGKAKVKLNLPQFNGTLRLMAVAVSGSRFGSATEKVLVREPIVLTPTFPRFAAPGDRFVIPVSIFNGTGKDGDVELKLIASGPVEIDGHDIKRFKLSEKQEKTAHFAVIARDVSGKCEFRLEARLNQEKVTDTTELAVRPAQPFTTKASSGVVTSKAPLTLNLKESWLPGTGDYSLCLASLPSLKLTGSLRYLLGYPYGCVEQTTSKVFPLLYFSDLARVAQPDLFADKKAERFIYKGIHKLESMQLRDGGFSYWPGGDYSSTWSSIYAAHFLVEARKAGFTVSDKVHNRILNYLEKVGKGKDNNNSSWGLQQRVYALYVLSLAGRPQRSSMAYIKNQKYNVLYPDTKIHLAAAYYYAGDKKTARDLMPLTFTPYVAKRERGGNFNSTIRTDAIVLGVLADVDPGNSAIPKLMKRLADSVKVERWGTTQENAFAFMALGKIYNKKAANASYTGQVLVNGIVIAEFNDKEPKRIKDQRLGAGEVTVKVSGQGECFYYAESGGVSPNPVPEEDNGIEVRREYYDRQGQKVNLNKIRQGDLIVVKITVKTRDDNVENVAIVDLLPTGIEIENPRLATSAKLDWLKTDVFSPSYMDIRDDRLLLFANFYEADTYYFYYAARAVSCGSYTLPVIKGECMYEPEVMSISSGGRVQIEK